MELDIYQQARPCSSVSSIETMQTQLRRRCPCPSIDINVFCYLLFPSTVGPQEINGRAPGSVWNKQNALLVCCHFPINFHSSWRVWILNINFGSYFRHIAAGAHSSHSTRNMCNFLEFYNWEDPSIYKSTLLCARARPGSRNFQLGEGCRRGHLHDGENFADGSFAALQGSQQQVACVTLTMCGAEVDTDRIKILGNRHLVNFHNRWI